MSHLVLLGDSVFDNGAYVGSGEPDVARQVSARLPGGNEVTLLAVDGHLTSDVSSQIERLPSSATHLFLSVGGNDALQHLDAIERFETEISRFSEAIKKLREIQEDFRRAYRPVVEELLGAGLPTTLCTIYNGNFQEASQQAPSQQVMPQQALSLQALVDTILPVIGDVIVEAAAENGLPLIDLGRVLGEPDLDYANPIEPSAHGGAKIAEVITEVLSSHEFASPRAEIYV
jgi:lysophospholipase L1-like esterase